MPNSHVEKIAILLPDLRPGGVERVRLLLAEEFLKRGYEVDLVLMRARGELLGSVPDGARVVELSVDRIRHVVWSFRSYLRRERPDAVLAAMMPLTVCAAIAMLSARSRARLVLSEHTDLRQSTAAVSYRRFPKRVLVRQLYRRANKIVAVSQGVKDSIACSFGTPEQDVQVIYNPIRKMVSRPLSEPDRDLLEWWRAGGIRLLSVGSLKKVKDFPTLCNAIGRLPHELNARLIILGEGSERQALEKLVHENNLDGHIRLPGYRESPYDFLRYADLFVLSSVYEGLGNVLTEALAAGVRIVSTDCPSGPAEILRDGELGQLVNVGDPGEMAHAIVKELNIDRGRDTLQKRAGDFSVEVAADHYLELLAGSRG